MCYGRLQLALPCCKKVSEITVPYKIIAMHIRSIHHFHAHTCFLIFSKIVQFNDICPGATVPFICRYRSDLISPLAVEEVHNLSRHQKKHEALTNLRKRALGALNNSSKDRTSSEVKEIKRQMKVTTSKTKLEELYAPFKAPVKGSLAERAACSFPDLTRLVGSFWNSSENNSGKDLVRVIAKSEKSRTQDGMTSYTAAVHLLASRIAASPLVVDAVDEIARREMVLSLARNNKRKNAKGSKSRKKERSKFEAYFDKTYKVGVLKVRSTYV